MTILQNYKDHLTTIFGTQVPNHGKSYFKMMLDISLSDQKNSIINTRQHNDLIKDYIKFDTNSTSARTSYIIKVYYYHLVNLSNLLGNKLKKQKNIGNKLLARINEHEEEISNKNDVNIDKDKTISNIQSLKQELVENNKDIETLVIEHDKIKVRIKEYNAAITKINNQQIEIEKYNVPDLASNNKVILEILNSAYKKDENNQLSGFVYYIKESYKNSLKGRDIKILLPSIATQASILLTILPISSDLHENDSSNGHKYGQFTQWLDDLHIDDDLFSMLAIDVNNSDSIVEKLNNFLAIIFAIHGVIAQEPSEVTLKMDFIRKMATVDFTGDNDD